MNINNRYTSLDILQKSENSSDYVNDILSNYFYENKIDLRDKRFINNIVYGSIRMRGRYDKILSDLYNGNYSTLKIKLKNILRLGCYQIEAMSSVPDHAAVSSSVEITKKSLRGYEQLVNALLRKYISVKDEYRFIPEDISSYDYLSHPQWLVDRWINNFGKDRTFSLCEYNNQIPEIWFRINNKSLKKSIETQLKDLNISFIYHEINDIFFKCSSSFSVIESHLFKSGLLTIQNPLNGFIVNLINPRDNDIIIDGCSAPGGKGSLVSIIAPNSTIYSIDKNKTRMSKLISSIKRQKIKNIETQILDMSRDILPKANKILIDVPCSGTGVINRRVDLKWNRKEDDIKKTSTLQYKILENTSKYLLRNGKLVYSTCSIEPEENMDIINKFLIKNKNFSLIDASTFVDKKIVKNNSINVLPGDYNLDGGFAAILKKI